MKNFWQSAYGPWSVAILILIGAYVVAIKVMSVVVGGM